jgi:hypothetical protein
VSDGVKEREKKKNLEKSCYFVSHFILKMTNYPDSLYIYSFLLFDCGEYRIVQHKTIQTFSIIDVTV